MTTLKSYCLSNKDASLVTIDKVKNFSYKMRLNHQVYSILNLMLEICGTVQLNSGKFMCERVI